MNKRISGRTEQLNLKVSPDFRKKLKLMAAKEDCLLIEVLEKSLEFYQKNYKSPKKAKKLSDRVKIIQPKPKPKLAAYLHANFNCDNCGNEYYNETAYSYARNLEEFKRSSTYCSNCVK